MDGEKASPGRARQRGAAENSSKHRGARRGGLQQMTADPRERSAGLQELLGVRERGGSILGGRFGRESFDLANLACLGTAQAL
mmetsp:Transcript_13696/g.38898  ORF Transcript_13696/g.38898 Transcript_13696/m.38898 type:complete len:83 (-) Transcript_13696:164-412(-)